MYVCVCVQERECVCVGVCHAHLLSVPVALCGLGSCVNVVSHILRDPVHDVSILNLLHHLRHVLHVTCLTLVPLLHSLVS